MRRTGCRYDLVSLGEVMLRLDPGERRIRTARSFGVWEGGGEYNVARGLRRCFGLRTAVVTALVGQRGRPAARGPDPRTAAWTRRYVRWMPFDGIGRRSATAQLHRARLRGPRRGRRLRPRAHRGLASLRPEDVDWDRPVRRAGRALVPHRRHLRRAVGDHAEVAAEAAMKAARRPRHGGLLRPQLPAEPVEGDRRARRAPRRSTGGWLRLVDVMIGNEEDFTRLPRLRGRGHSTTNLSELEPAALPTR